MGLIRNMHILYDYLLKRWFTPKELLLAQVFPIGGVDLGCPFVGLWLSSFQRERPAPWPARSRNGIIHQVGNSMNVHAIGIALLWLLEHINFEPRCQASVDPALRSFVARAKSFF